MVTYSNWVSIVRQVAMSKGANLSSFDTNSEVVSVAADIWNRRTAELQNATERQAQRVAQREVSVS